MQSIKSKKIRIILLLALAAIFSFFVLKKIDLTTVDLGRHIRNGQDFFAGNFGFLRANFYSFTNADFPFLNHHWATGIIFFLIFKLAGFYGLHLFFLFLGLASFFLMFFLAEKETNTKTAFLLSLMLIPLLSYRKEIRAEIFSCFFAVSFFWLLWQHRKGVVSDKMLFIIPVLEILWVNIHIYFFLGIAIIGAFLLERVIFPIISKIKTKTILSAKKLKTIFIVFLSSIAAMLVNPFGIRGVLHPLNVYNNYGYRVLEEQSIWFLEKLNIVHPVFLLFKVVLFLVFLSFVLVLIKNTRKFSIVMFFLALGFGAMACVSIRNITLFGFFALPILAVNIKILFFQKKESPTSVDNEPRTAGCQEECAEKERNIPLQSCCNIRGEEINFSFKKSIIVMLVIVFCATVIYTYQQCVLAQQGNFGIGLVRDNGRSAEFFKEKNIRGPIFNNYDIGGYLIFHLYPQERVFVDNRPEVYPSSFFNDAYIPMQENDELWKEQDEKYNFNAIFFSHQDYTPWGQAFLISRINDPAWSPVFADDYAIIFLKRNEENKDIIEKYEIQKENFSVRRH